MLLQDRLEKGRERLDDAVEQLHLLCEPVPPPAGELEHIHYFCGNTEIATNLKEREPQRAAFYKAVVALVRAYANLADDLPAAGYADVSIDRIRRQVKHFADIRDVVRKASGESLDLKSYEADMRHLLDTYVHADQPRTISPFEGIGLLDLIVRTGIAEAISSQLGAMKSNQDAVAETIENNVRSHIVKEEANDPAFYERMSALLDEVIRLRKEKAIAYEDYLKRVAEIATQVRAGYDAEASPMLDTPGKRALYNNLASSEPTDGVHQGEIVGAYGDSKMALTIAVDAAIKAIRPDGWRGVISKEQVVKRALFELLKSEAEVERVFPIIKQQPEY